MPIPPDDLNAALALEHESRIRAHMDRIAEHLDDLEPEPKRTYRKRNGVRSDARLSEDDVRFIRSSSMSQQALADKYGVCRRTITQVIQRVTYKAIQ